MPAPDSLSALSDHSSQDKELSGTLTVSISVPQRMRPPMLSSSAAKKENAASVGQKKPSSIRRPTKYSRLSDRWPVLSKIIRTARSAASSQDYPTAPDDSSDVENEDYLISVQRVNNRTISSSLAYNRHDFHRSSPEFPSPLSGIVSGKRLLLVRHNYAHRGYSQSALHLQRDFWGRRKGEWDEYEYILYQAGLSIEEAYCGMVEDVNGCSHPLPPHLKYGPRDRKSIPTTQKGSKTKLYVPEFLNLATFPRLGDLSSTRDPFLTSVDTWFADIPLWTLSKMIWMYDINHRSGNATRHYRHGRMSDTFLEDFDMSNCSAETLSDASDLTLVDTIITIPRSPEGHMKGPRFSRNQLKSGLLASPSFGSFASVDKQVRPWEVSWFSRWEVLYNQVRLAADIAASSGDPSPLANGSREAARIILTTADVLYDPLCNYTNGGACNNWNHAPVEKARPRNRSIILSEEEDDDYGDVVQPSESVYRLGAYVNPFSMFDTAAIECDSALTLDASSDNFDIVTVCSSEDHASELTGSLQQLAICFQAPLPVHSFA